MFGYCHLCKNAGKVLKGIEILESPRLGFYLEEELISEYGEYCTCKHGKDLKLKENYPILSAMLNSVIVQFFIRWFHKLTSEYFWSDVRYNTRKILRFPIRIWEFRKIIFNDEDWGSDYLMSIIEFKLLRLEKALRNDKWQANSDRRVKEIRIALNHLDRYRNIEKYTEAEDSNYWLEPEHDDKGKILHYHFKTDRTPRGTRLIKHEMELERYHFSEFWRIVSAKMERWCT